LFTVSNYAKKHIAQHHVKQFREKVCKQQNIITFKRKARMLSPVSNTAKKTPMLQRKKQLDTANGASLKSEKLHEWWNKADTRDHQSPESSCNANRVRDI